MTVTDLTSPAARRDTATEHGTVRNWIGGRWVDVDAPLVDVHAPADGRVIARTPLSRPDAVDAAVQAARAAFPAWAALPINERVQVLYS